MDSLYDPTDEADVQRCLTKLLNALRNPKVDLLTLRLLARGAPSLVGRECLACHQDRYKVYCSRKAAGVRTRYFRCPSCDDRRNEVVPDAG